MGFTIHTTLKWAIDWEMSFSDFSPAFDSAFSHLRSCRTQLLAGTTGSHLLQKRQVSLRNGTRFVHGIPPAHTASQTAVGVVNVVPAQRFSSTSQDCCFIDSLLLLYALSCPLVCTRCDVLWWAPADEGNYSISGSKHDI